MLSKWRDEWIKQYFGRDYYDYNAGEMTKEYHTALLAEIRKIVNKTQKNCNLYPIPEIYSNACDDILDILKEGE